jgi:hypothetical protein
MWEACWESAESSNLGFTQLRNQIECAVSALKEGALIEISVHIQKGNYEACAKQLDNLNVSNDVARDAMQTMCQQLNRSLTDLWIRAESIVVSLDPANSDVLRGLFRDLASLHTAQQHVHHFMSTEMQEMIKPEVLTQKVVTRLMGHASTIGEKLASQDFLHVEKSLAMLESTTDVLAHGLPPKSKDAILDAIKEGRTKLKSALTTALDKYNPAQVFKKYPQAKDEMTKAMLYLNHLTVSSPRDLFVNLEEACRTSNGLFKEVRDQLYCTLQNEFHAGMKLSLAFANFDACQALVQSLNAALPSLPHGLAAEFQPKVKEALAAAQSAKENATREMHAAMQTDNFKCLLNRFLSFGRLRSYHNMQLVLARIQAQIFSGAAEYERHLRAGQLETVLQDLPSVYSEWVQYEAVTNNWKREQSRWNHCVIYCDEFLIAVASISTSPTSNALTLFAISRTGLR